MTTSAQEGEYSTMADPRLAELAAVLIGHSTRLQAGEVVLIEAFDLPESELITQLIEKAVAVGAHPLVLLKDNTVLASLYKNASAEALTLAGQVERFQMERVHAYIGIRGATNASDLADVPVEKLDLYQQVWNQPVHFQVRVPKTKWVVLRYPTPSMAQAARMSTRTFREYFLSVCTTDYAAMARRLEPLRDRMARTDRVRIVSPGTDVSFSIKGMGIIPCAGQHNIPDGEIFTAPHRESVEGVIAYNTPSLYQGTVFEGICFRFEKGRIVDANCRNEPGKLNAILDADEGARYIGEWSIAVNNAIRHPMLDTLFDEKIGGSIHLTPGNAYDEADNGNRSRVHWDIVLIQTPEYGGGQLYFDGELIRQDGRFLPAELAPLNEGLAA